jgi:hypothetical protein
MGHHPRERLGRRAHAARTCCLRHVPPFVLARGGLKAGSGPESVGCRADRLRRIRQELRSGRYESVERLAATVYRLFQALQPAFGEPNAIPARFGPVG